MNPAKFYEFFNYAYTTDTNKSLLCSKILLLEKKLKSRDWKRLHGIMYMAGNYDRKLEYAAKDFAIRMIINENPITNNENNDLIRQFFAYFQFTFSEFIPIMTERSKHNSLNVNKISPQEYLINTHYGEELLKNNSREISENAFTELVTNYYIYAVDAINDGLTIDHTLLQTVMQKLRSCEQNLEQLITHNQAGELTLSRLQRLRNELEQRLNQQIVEQLYQAKQHAAELVKTRIGYFKYELDRLSQINELLQLPSLEGEQINNLQTQLEDILKIQDIQQQPLLRLQLYLKQQLLLRHPSKMLEKIDYEAQKGNIRFGTIHNAVYHWRKYVLDNNNHIKAVNYLEKANMVVARGCYVPESNYNFIERKSPNQCHFVIVKSDEASFVELVTYYIKQHKK